MEPFVDLLVRRLGADVCPVQVLRLAEDFLNDRGGCSFRSFVCVKHFRVLRGFQGDG